MSSFKTIFVVSTIIMLHVVSAKAELQVIGTATAGYDEDGIVGDDYYNLIYDTEQQIVFLDYVSTTNQWINQMNWAAGLSLTDVSLNPGFTTTADLTTGWRLPTVETPEATEIPSPPAPEPSSLFDRMGARSDHCMYDGYRSEMACLYYSALGNVASPADCGSENNYDPFINLLENIVGPSFWTDSDVGTPGNTYKWDFNLCTGELFGGGTVPEQDYVELPAVAVHDAIVYQNNPTLPIGVDLIFNNGSTGSNSASAMWQSLRIAQDFIISNDSYTAKDLIVKTWIRDNDVESTITQINYWFYADDGGSIGNLLYEGVTTSPVYEDLSVRSVAVDVHYIIRNYNLELPDLIFGPGHYWVALKAVPNIPAVYWAQTDGSSVTGDYKYALRFSESQPELGWVVWNLNFDVNLYGIFTPGDLNKDGFVDLQDAILGLQVTAGESPLDVSTNGDVNDDLLIGAPEVIYSIDKASN